MGGDGGVVATKRKYFVKQHTEEAKVDPAELVAARFTTCALTGEPLREPIVACRLGRLYNKEEVVAHLLAKKKMPKLLRHVKGLKSVVTCQVKWNDKYVASKEADSMTYSTDASGGAFMCPVTDLTTSGKYRFIVLWTCGHVLAERALKEIPGTKCLVCSKEFTPDDVVTLCLPDDEERVLRTKLFGAKADDTNAGGDGSQKRTRDGAEGNASATKEDDGTDDAEAAAPVPMTSAAKRHASIMEKATAAVEAQKATSASFASMLTSSKPGGTKSSADELFMRTATPLWSMSRTHS